MLKILHPVDGSANAARATRKLVETVSWLSEAPRIELLAVHLPVPRMPNMHFVVSESDISRYYQEELAAMTGPSREILDRHDIAYEMHTRIGQVAPEIVRHAQEHGCDMIVMGTRGMSALANMVLGSVATRVLHLASVPVLLVP